MPQPGYPMVRQRFTATPTPSPLLCTCVLLQGPTSWSDHPAPPYSSHPGYSERRDYGPPPADYPRGRLVDKRSVTSTVDYVVLTCVTVDSCLQYERDVDDFLRWTQSGRGGSGRDPRDRYASSSRR